MTGKSKVLVVDDEPQILRFLRPSLQAAGYEVVTEDTAAGAVRAIATAAPDLVILDLGLPDRDGKEVIAEVRAWSRVPIIILSARDREAEKVEALDLGADDYINKPFGIGELMARIRTALRHRIAVAGEVAVLKAGGLEIDTVLRSVKRDGETIRLTPKEYELLQVLARHSGRVVTHRQVLAAVWGPAHTSDTQYLRVFIGQLRQKIEKDPTDPQLIATEPGVGYRFIAGDD